MTRQSLKHTKTCFVVERSMPAPAGVDVRRQLVRWVLSFEFASSGLMVGAFTCEPSHQPKKAVL